MSIAHSTTTRCVSLDLADLPAFLEQLSRQYTVYVPVRRQGQLCYTTYPVPPGEIILGEVRAAAPLKAFFSRSREAVAEGFSDRVPSSSKPVALIGAKACDLKGLKVQDAVFQNGGCQDPCYARRRGQNLIISADCTLAIETCFCLALGVCPFPQEQFDLNLSPVGEQLVVEVGSDKGRKLVEAHGGLFRDADEKLIRAREAQRQRVRTEVERNLQRLALPSQERYHGIIARNYTSPIWEEEAKTCVECGACTIICPTCHCFLLYDQKAGDSMARMRVWDSCMFKGYARVAGGGNPRGHLWMRLRNRFEKKFDFFPKVAGLFACTGCGRCVSACPAKIDIRNVLKKLVESDGHA